MSAELYKAFLEALLSGKGLSAKEAEILMDAITEKAFTDIQTAALLIALRAKGENSEEISGAAKALLKKACKIEVNGDILVDTCGTGGDMLQTFNVSTTVAIVCAAGGIPVAKHGNKSVSSKSGSADLLLEMGAKVELTPEGIKRCIEGLKLGFIFAPAYHQALKNAALIRRELGTKTIFNLLGPLINPAFPTHQLVGVFDERFLKPIAETLRKLGRKRAMVVHGCGADELCVWGENKVAFLKEDGSIDEFSFFPEDVGIKRSSIEEVKGGLPHDNALISLRILSGERGAKRDMVLLNAGAVFLLVGWARDLREGISIASEIIDSGKAKEKLNEFIRFTKELI